MLSYEQITQTTEQRIRDCLSKPQGNNQERDWAHGAYILWCQLTRSRSNEADRRRLQALMDPS